MKRLHQYRPGVFARVGEKTKVKGRVWIFTGGHWWCASSHHRDLETPAWLRHYVPKRTTLQRPKRWLR